MSLDIICKKSEFQSITQTIYKNELKWIINLNIKPKAIKLLEGNILENLYNLKLYNDFVDAAQKARFTPGNN